MSPVHVIVGEDVRAEDMWANAFTGAVDLYRFERNVEAFERLTAAEAPIDLVVLTPAQQGPFNLTPDQFIARVLEGPLATGRFLSNLHVIVVGQPIARSHPRVMAVSTLEAAIRLVKFGEIERTPAPRPVAPVVPSGPPVSGDDLLHELSLSSSVISSIWDAPARTEHAAPEARVVGGGAAPARPAEPELPALSVPDAHGTQLFSRATAPGFISVSGSAPAPAAAASPVTGGGHAAMVGAPGEAVEVSSGALQPSRPYQLPHGAGYRGPVVRAGQIQAARHGQPVPPAVASQVQAMVYGSVGNPHDPLLTWSNGARVAAQAAPVPAPSAQPAAPMPVQHVAASAPQRSVPLEPPVGAYGGSPAVPAAPVAPVDPFLQRAEQAGGSVSFG